jgi:hypothetical protein
VVGIRGDRGPAALRGRRRRVRRAADRHAQHRRDGRLHTAKCSIARSLAPSEM